QGAARAARALVRAVRRRDRGGTALAQPPLLALLAAALLQRQQLARPPGAARRGPGPRGSLPWERGACLPVRDAGGNWPDLLHPAVAVGVQLVVEEDCGIAIASDQLDLISHSGRVGRLAQLDDGVLGGEPLGGDVRDRLLARVYHDPGWRWAADHRRQDGEAEVNRRTPPGIGAVAEDAPAGLHL